MIFLVCWMLALVTGVGIGVRRIGRLRATIMAGLMLSLGLVGHRVLDVTRIVQPGPPASAPTLVLPLYSCADASEYWPGGRRHAVAMAQDIRDLRALPECGPSAALGDLTYLAVMMLIFMAMGMLAALVLGALARDRRIISAITKIAGLLRALLPFGRG